MPHKIVKWNVAEEKGQGHPGKIEKKNNNNNPKNMV